MHADAAMLDNPVWATLVDGLARFGLCNGDTRWFPESIGPFVAVPSPYVIPNLDAAFSDGMGSAAYFLRVCPRTLPAGWRYAAQSHVLQMVPPDLSAVSDAAVGRELGASDQQQMLELAQIAFPFFFRQRTAQLGAYLGVFVGERRVAMAGERMRIGAWQEISGVCTHPDHVGRGHARELTRALLRRHLAAGLRSFLHVSDGNAGARKLYTAMGFTERAQLPLGRVQRM